LVHGITHEQQAAGDPEPEVLLDFLEFAGKSPLVAFHAPFDQTFLKRYMKTHLGLGFNNPFLDLAWLMPALVPVENSKLVGLDEWLKKFGISVNVRHSAEEDAMVTAELLLIALARARQQGRNNLNELIELARSRQLDHSQGGRG
ncbi:MAG: 3'-5' exonuclease, partial [Deltaproteobacteria bacterium]|nr:3'-5' exonuclease [Deltaproteobacteria bacterium]